MYHAKIFEYINHNKLYKSKNVPFFKGNFYGKNLSVLFFAMVLTFETNHGWPSFILNVPKQRRLLISFFIHKIQL